MPTESESNLGRNYFDNLFARTVARDMDGAFALDCIAGAYLDGKPQRLGKKKLTRAERDTLFWTSRAVRDCSPVSWCTANMVLALARYLGQDTVTIDGLLSRVAADDPDALTRAVRYSGLVLRKTSPRRGEFDVAVTAKLTELRDVLDLFDRAYRERVVVLDSHKAMISDLSAFDLLIYASLYAFERLVPGNLKSAAPEPAADAERELAWDAMADLLAWKLKEAEISSLRLNDELIGRSLTQHLRCFLSEPDDASAWKAIRRLGEFHALLSAQIELNEFISRSADAFSYNDGIRFERRGDILEIVEVDPAVSTAWRRDGRKLERLHGYWFHRAIEDFIAYVAADPTKWAIGLPENEDAIRLAWIRALQSQLRLREVYGVADTVTAEHGESVDVFKAMLSLNLMSVFFLRDFLGAFTDRLNGSGHWIAALRLLAMDGLREGMQNRLPLTWLDRNTKVANITGWTVDASTPQGSTRMASAILDFWTWDMVAMAERLQRNEAGVTPSLFERPILKFGPTLVQLPWIVGMQNNSSAAINNLRRLGARRGEAREETQRIENGLAQLLESRGFKTLLNWKPPRDEDDPGEVDVIAVHGLHLFVLEVKSTFLRRLQREAWIHAATTLRKAGQQVRRKVDAVRQAIESDPLFRELLGLAQAQFPTHHHGWIVDTSIECDHQRFAGYLKLSLEELLIALRDDRYLLNDPGGLLAGHDQIDNADEPAVMQRAWTLYPHGFSADRFVEVIETEAAWDESARNHQ